MGDDMEIIPSNAELSRGDQPCASFLPHQNDMAYLSNSKPQPHSCPKCNGTRYFCGNCFKDHHEGGWQSCWDTKKAQECAAAFEPLAHLENATRDRNTADE